MEVDSFRFLPRSFRGMYEHAEPAGPPVWTPFAKRLAEARLTLLSSAGLYLEGRQEPFDGEREKREPTWGDPSFRAIPQGTPKGSLGMMHLHVNNEDVLADHNIALPLDVLADLAADGVVGQPTDEHYSVMGYQENGLAAWREETAPALVERLQAQGTDGVILAPV